MLWLVQLHDLYTDFDYIYTDIELYKAIAAKVSPKSFKNTKITRNIIITFSNYNSDAVLISNI